MSEGSLEIVLWQTPAAVVDILGKAVEVSPVPDMG